MYSLIQYIVFGPPAKSNSSVLSSCQKVLKHSYKTQSILPMEYLN